MDCAQSQQTSALNIDGNVYEEDYQEDEEDIGSPNLKKKVRLNTAGTAQSSNSAATCENSQNMTPNLIFEPESPDSETQVAEEIDEGE